MRKITFYILALVSAVIVLSSCEKEYETIESVDQKRIAAYKAANGNVSFIDDDKGYSYSITSPGTGALLLNSDSVYYQYAFKKLDGTVITQSNDLMRPGTLLGYTDQFSIANGNYSFTAVREVLGKLKRGGKAVLILPSKMAFGKNGLAAFGVGSNECLLVELGVYEQGKRHEIDAYEMGKFISNNNLTFLTDPSGIRYQIITPGTGTELLGGYSTLVATYTGRYLDGTVFDAGSGISFRLDQLIKGWQIVLPGKITSGGKIRILIPSHLAYGLRPLDFDIEVTSITNN